MSQQIFTAPTSGAASPTSRSVLSEVDPESDNPFRWEHAKLFACFLTVVLLVTVLAGVFHPRAAKLAQNGWVAFFALVLQGCLYWFALRKAFGPELREQVNSELELLEAHVEADLRHSVTPDWQYLAHRLQACFESIDDKLRSLAAAALALGLGTTIAFLLINVPASLEKLSIELGKRPPTGDSTQSLDQAAQEVAQGTLFSLAGSLLGACSHLLLVLLVLPQAERRCLELDRQARAKLREGLDAALAARPKAAPAEPVPDLTAAELKKQLQTQLRNLRTTEEGLNAFAKTSTETLQRLEGAWADRLKKEAALAGAAREESALREKQLVDNIRNLKGSLDRIKVALDELPAQVASAGSRVGHELARGLAQELRPGRPVDPP